MVRIRQRTAIMLCAVFLSLFLTIYFIINYATPIENKKPNLGAIQSKLQQLENGMQKMQHRLNEKLEKQIKIERNTDDVKQLHVKKSMSETNHAVAQKIYPAQCELNMQETPQPDIQMLDLYTKMNFHDINGGVWKQGWPIKYDELKFNDHHKLKVFVVPHSHNDPGWIKTFDDYYEHDTKHILSNALRHLNNNPEMTFIWAEISYFSRFYEDLGEKSKKEIKKLIQNKQLEFVTGGWVMPDEANSHWQSVLLQLTEGQSWLKTHLNVTPISSWSIDPFGHSPTLPYLLQKSGFENLLIQRTHYSVKKELAQKMQLEFRWRQLWDNTGSTELFTHMMPFYSYDIPHTCGPDPKICCQFDFKRIAGFGLSCPWRVPPQHINEQNVAKKASLIVDQWKKKAELYRTNILLVPLGDDFRYSQSTEWDVQRINYMALFDHINSERKYFVEAKFGTLQEYFDAVHQVELQNDFPKLSGDFFTYADREDNYWSGYYTSRPYHKRMDRVLLHYVRSAEMLSSWNSWESAARFDKLLEQARRELSLFQHHDGITGTAKKHVVQDYAQRMLDAVKQCRHVMQQAAYRLLTKPSIYNADYKFTYFYLDDSRWPGPDDSRTTIILGEQLSLKHVVFHNSLPQHREELVEFYVSSPYMSVTDFDKNPVTAQVTPVWSWYRYSQSNTVTPEASTTKYRLLFKVRVPPLGLATYIIQSEPEDSKPAYTTFASNFIHSSNPISLHLGGYPEEVKFGEHREISLRVDDGPTVAFTEEGMLKSIQLDDTSPHIPVLLKFYKYGTRVGGSNSGAYLFLPNGPAQPFVNIQPPVVLVTRGPLETSVTVGLPFVTHQTILRGGAPEIRNLVDIGEMDDVEIVMRLSTHIKNNDTFYTDLNGLQMIKRQRFRKLPLQANFYPVPSAIYIEDQQMRLTVVSGQPLGGTSLAEGEVEIMQDRRLTQDDERGLGQGVLDNQPVLHIFRLILENLKNDCKKPVDSYPAGALTLNAYCASKHILNPLDKFIYAENDWVGVQANFGADHVSVDDDFEIAVIRNLQTSPTTIHVAHDPKSRQHSLWTGIIVHRTNLLECPSDGHRSGVLNLKNLIQFGKSINTVQRTTLTFLRQLETLNDINEITMCPMDTEAFIIRRHNS